MKNHETTLKNHEKQPKPQNPKTPKPHGQQNTVIKIIIILDAVGEPQKLPEAGYAVEAKLTTTSVTIQEHQQYAVNHQEHCCQFQDKIFRQASAKPRLPDVRGGKFDSRPVDEHRLYSTTTVERRVHVAVLNQPEVSRQQNQP